MSNYSTRAFLPTVSPTLTGHVLSVDHAQLKRDANAGQWGNGWQEASSKLRLTLTGHMFGISHLVEARRRLRIGRRGAL